MIKFNSENMRHYKRTNSDLQHLFEANKARFSTHRERALYSSNPDEPDIYKEYEVHFTFNFYSSGQVRDFTSLTDLFTIVENLSAEEIMRGFVEITVNAYPIEDGKIDLKHPVTQYGIPRTWRYITLAYGVYRPVSYIPRKYTGHNIGTTMARLVDPNFALLL